MFLPEVEEKWRSHWDGDSECSVIANQWSLFAGAIGMSPW
jgi:hypothetical protein